MRPHAGQLGDNEQSQRLSQREQDGSEVKSVELECLIAEGQTLFERRDAFEIMHDQTADRFGTGAHERRQPTFTPEPASANQSGVGATDATKHLNCSHFGALVVTAGGSFAPTARCVKNNLASITRALAAYTVKVK